MRPSSGTGILVVDEHGNKLGWGVYNDASLYAIRQGSHNPEGLHFSKNNGEQPQELNILMTQFTYFSVVNLNMPLRTPRPTIPGATGLHDVVNTDKYFDQV